MILDPQELIFSNDVDFTEKALLTFRFQYANNELYKRYVDHLNCDTATVNTIENIPFLPISFFKTHPITTTNFDPAMVFESSGTTGTETSKHIVKDLSLYEKSFISCFEQLFGAISDYCILGLLPSYLERNGSSLIYMVQKMIERSGHPSSGFYLNDFRDLNSTLQTLENSSQKTVLLGVTYALLDFCSLFPMELKHTIVMETGGMKGRKKELLRSEVHRTIKTAFSLDRVYSEYGMTELLSQAYSLGDGLFGTPPWVRVLIRDGDDPLSMYSTGILSRTGGLNIIDLANLYSCSFIATEDVGRLLPDNQFEVLGRLDNSDIRGCSLLFF